MDATDIHDLPFVDAHTSIVAAAPDAVWRAVAETLDQNSDGRGTKAVARLLGCADLAARGPRPPAAGSAIPGFHVVTAVPGRELALAGSHRFSTYALVFRLEEAGPGRTRVRAESWAAFPGPAGRLYRLAVIGTGGHARGMRHILTTVRRRALKERG